MRPVNHIQVILPQTLAKLGIKERYDLEVVMYHWRDIVGERIAAHARPTGVQDNTLIVSVTNSVWCHHLSVLKLQIIDKINNFIGEKLVTDIRFKAGYFVDYPNENNTNENLCNIKQEMAAIQLDEADCCQIDTVIDQVKDEKLRQRLRRFARNQLRLRKVRLRQDWHQCAACTAFCPPEKKYCISCEVERREATAKRLRQLLLEAPWLTYSECRNYIDCNLQEFLQARETLCERMLREFYNGREDQPFLIALVMVLKRLKPDRVNQEVLTTTLEEIRRKNYGSTPRR